MSMSFIPSILDHENKCSDWVFTNEELTDGTWQGDEDNEVFVPNPSYRPDLNLDMTGSAAYRVLRALGYAPDDEIMSFPIEEFIGRCSSWLQANIGRRSAGIEAALSRGDGGCTMIGGGEAEGFLNRAISRAAVIAREGKARGANIMVVG